MRKLEQHEIDEHERMKEFFFGPKLHMWCKECGERGRPILVEFAYCRNHHTRVMKTGKMLNEG